MSWFSKGCFRRAHAVTLAHDYHRDPSMAERIVRTETALRRALWGLNPAAASVSSESQRSCRWSAPCKCRSCAACRLLRVAGHAVSDRLYDAPVRSGRGRTYDDTTATMLPLPGRPPECRCLDHDVSRAGKRSARSVGDSTRTQAIRPSWQAGHWPSLSFAAADPISPRGSLRVFVSA